MNTKITARCAMYCALYGALLVLNSLSGLLVETTFPFLLGLPLYAAALSYGRRPALLCLAAMAVLTLLLSGVSTWLCAGAFLACGLLYGCIYHAKGSPLTALLISTVLLSVFTFLQMSLLASLFGYDVQEDRELFAFALPYISFVTIQIVLSVTMGFLESLVMYLLSLAIDARLPQPRKRNLKPAHFSMPAWSGWLFLLLCLGYLLLQTVISCPVGIRDALFLACMGLGTAWIIQGCLLLLQRSRRSKQSVFLLVMGACLPGIQLFYLLYALLVVLSGRGDMESRRLK